MTPPLNLPHVDRDDPTPKYLQAREILIRAIRSGVLAPGTKLPSTKKISSLIDVSLITAHKALEGLVQMGWLRREVGRGTVVRDDGHPALSLPQYLAIGLMLDQRDPATVDNYYHSTLINGLRREARGDSQKVQFFFLDRYDLREKVRPDLGLVCIHPPLEAQREIMRLAERYPLLVLGGTFPDPHLASVDSDNENAARAAVRHLITLGHRRFMIVSGPLNLSNARDRIDGATMELRTHGLSIAPSDLPVSADSVVLDNATRRQIEQRLAAREHPTAIIAGGGHLALAAIQCVRRAGMRVPGDVSVVGFDDPASAMLVDPPLTTVRQPLEAMAGCAYRLIRDAIVSHRTVIESVRLPAELIVRESTGPAPQS